VKEIGVRKAAEEVGVGWQTVNKWRKEAPPLVEPSEIRILQGTKRRKYPPKKKEEKKPEERKEDVVVAAEVIEKKTAIIIQSPLGGNITPRQVLQKIPAGSDSVYIRVDENKLYWVKGDESGAVDIWG
jgi:transposase